MMVEVTYLCSEFVSLAGKAVWDVHRHRVAPEIHKALTEYFMDGEAEVVSAHLVGLGTSNEGKILAKLDLGNKTEEREYDYIVNCTGPNNCKQPCPNQQWNFEAFFANKERKILSQT